MQALRLMLGACALHSASHDALLPLPLLQLDAVLSELVSSCRTADPQLLDELRGELLFMARLLEQPVRRLGWHAAPRLAGCVGKRAPAATCHLWRALLSHAPRCRRWPARATRWLLQMLSAACSACKTRWWWAQSRWGH